MSNKVVIIANLYHETVVGAIDGQCFFVEQATSETETLERCRISEAGIANQLIVPWKGRTERKILSRICGGRRGKGANVWRVRLETCRDVFWNV